MNPHAAAALFAVGIMGLFVLAYERKLHTSIALWIPVVWLWIAASRPVSVWFGPGGSDAATVGSDQMLDGSPMDRLLFTVLIAMGIVVLCARGRRVLRVLWENVPLLLFFLYAGLSTLWSDYTDVSFKRWVKAVGDLVMILIVLTDSDRLTAVKRLLSRGAFLLIPASVYLIKYNPDFGRLYIPYTGEATYTGVTSNKNQLGYVCLLFGLGAVWRILLELRERRGAWRTKAGVLIAHGVVLAMVLWLFHMASSMTSFACFFMALILLVAANLKFMGRRAWVVHILVLAILAVSVSALFFNLGSGLVQTMGKDPSLTGRTDIWKLVLGMVRSPLFGTGFESFWLGTRLQKVWDVYWWHPVQAHDGYIDVYLNLGAVGLILLALILVAGYRNIIAAFRDDPRTTGLRLAYFVVAVAYNFTESAFKWMDPIWIFLLLSMVGTPGGWAPVRNKKAGAQPQFDRPILPAWQEPERVHLPSIPSSGVAP